MKEEEKKQLLLKDLCARLIYGVKVHINSPIEEQNSMELFDVNLEGGRIGVGNEKWAFRAIPIIDDEDETKVVKPYLRPMSSMTQDECTQLSMLLPKSYVVYSEEIHNINELTKILPEHLEIITDFYNSHYIDWRGLIPKGLALEAPKDMYK